MPKHYPSIFVKYPEKGPPDESNEFTGSPFAMLGYLLAPLLIWGFKDGLVNLPAALAIVGVIALIIWGMDVFPLIVMSPLWIVRWLSRFISQPSPKDPKIGVGLADEWLDGPY